MTHDSDINLIVKLNRSLENIKLNKNTILVIILSPWLEELNLKGTGK